ncbi:unnamed protein product [Symbiodinium sp. CCMP2592]|nr:unnamed protein product [Symbiodinium sp. CCMP2592]
MMTVIMIMMVVVSVVVVLVILAIWRTGANIGCGKNAEVWSAVEDRPQQATNVASRARMQRSGQARRDDFPSSASAASAEAFASTMPTASLASIERVKCLDEHEFRKLLGSRRLSEESEESDGIPVGRLWGMVPEEVRPKEARPWTTVRTPKRALLRGSSAELDLESVRLLPQSDTDDLQPRCKSGVWEKVHAMKAWASLRLRRKKASKACVRMVKNDQILPECLLIDWTHHV